MAKFRFTVRKQSSGYAASVTFYVYDTVSKGRVSVHAGSREQAQAQADDLNIGDLVKPHSEDSRPYAVRRGEAATEYYRRKTQGI